MDELIKTINALMQQTNELLKSATELINDMKDIKAESNFITNYYYTTENKSLKDEEDHSKDEQAKP